MNNDFEQQEKQEKKQKITKLISTGAFLLVVVSFVWFGKWLIDYKTFDYKATTLDALEKFYVSNQVSDLDPIVDLMDAYEKEEEIINKIQVLVANEVGKWYTYVDSKYTCDKTNKMACATQMEEFNILNTKLGVIHGVKSKAGRIIIDPKGYVELSAQGTKKVKTLKSTYLSAGSTNPLNSQEIYEKRCNEVSECENCRDLTCKCYFIDEDKVRNEIICLNKNATS
jgi:hypothetical protein